MIQFKISNQNGDQGLYNDFCKYLFSEIKDAVSQLADPRKYKVRERYVIESSVIKWRGDPPDSVDLMKLVVNSLELVKIRGEYFIRVNDRRLIPRSSTKVSTLVRLMEYGNEKIRPYPVITRVLRYYYENYQSLVKDFLIKRLRRRTK